MTSDAIVGLCLLSASIGSLLTLFACAAIDGLRDRRTPAPTRLAPPAPDNLGAPKIRVRGVNVSDEVMLAAVREAMKRGNAR